MKRRIALLTHDLSLGGGTAAVTRFLYRALSESGRYLPEIVSLAMSVGDRASVRLTAPMSWLHGPRAHVGEWQGLRYLHVGAWFSEVECQRYQPRSRLTALLDSYDLIQVVAGYPAWGYAAAASQRPVVLFTATTVAAERTARLAQERGARRTWLRCMTGLTRQVEARAVDRADCVFAESHSTLACLAKRVAGNRLFLGPPGVDTGFFQPRGTDSSGFILAVGRFSDPRKNVRLLLEAYARLCRSSASVPRLVLAGTPPSSDGMAYLSTAGISDRVEVCSNVSQETLAGLYREAGLFVLSSDEEGLGIVILEAMASGLPVVSTDCGGPATAVAAGETGLLSPVGDVDALAENMARLLGNPGLRARMGRAGRQVAVERFSLPVTGKVYLDKYDDLLQNRPLALGAAA